MSRGDPEAIILIIAVFALAALSLVLQAMGYRRRLDVVRAAIDADQPEAAQALLSDRWSLGAIRALVMAAVGLSLVVAGLYRPGELAGLFLIGAIVLVASVPALVYATLQGRGGGSAARGGCAAVGVAAACTVIVLIGVMLGGYLLLSREQARVSAIRALGPSLDQQAFAKRVSRLTGSRLGTTHPVIGGHHAESLLTGASYGRQSCGSPFHDKIRFSTLSPSYLNVWYIPDTEQYLVIGTARVDPSGVVVTDGYVSAKEALQPQGKGARAP